jgi:hypothetical protein
MEKGLLLKELPSENVPPTDSENNASVGCPPQVIDPPTSVISPIIGA